MKNRNYHSDVAFLDLFLNALLGFVFLFIVSWLLINPVAKNKTVEAKGEFIISVTWNDESDDDVDTWILEPTEKTVWFANRESDVTHLDRDDMGAKNDSFYDINGDRHQIKLNKEIVTIRGILPGEYTVNVQMYRKRDTAPTNVKIELIKVNPFSMVTIQDIVLSEEKQEETAFRFTVNPDGTVSGLNRLQKDIVGAVKGLSGGGNNR